MKNFQKTRRKLWEKFEKLGIKLPNLKYLNHKEIRSIISEKQGQRKIIAWESWIKFVVIFEEVLWTCREIFTRFWRFSNKTQQDFR